MHGKTSRLSGPLVLVREGGRKENRQIKEVPLRLRMNILSCMSEGMLY